MPYDNDDGRLRGRRLQATRLRLWAKDLHCAKCREFVEYPGGFELDHIRAISTATDKSKINLDANLQILCIHVDPIGWITAARVTEKGIEVEGEVAQIEEESPLKERLTTTWQMLKAKLVRGLSVGLKPLEAVRPSNPAP